MTEMAWAAVFSGLAAGAALVGWLAQQNGPGTAIAVGLSLAATVAALKGVRRKPVGSDGERGDTPPSPAHLLAVQEEERRRLSRELHDGVGQIVTAIKMELSSVRGAEDGSEEERLRRVRAHAEDAIRTVRDVSRLLRPSVLDDFGLSAALKWQTEDFARRTGIVCRLQCSIPDDRLLADPVKTCIYRTVQEALTNCAKHAAASTIAVDVLQDSGYFQVSVSDDGHGMLNLDSQSPGLGIVGMRERAQVLGGTLEVTSTAGAGTRVLLRIPDGS